jgi:arginase
MSSRNKVIVEAPSSLGLRSRGVERLPGRLLGFGLAERIGAREVRRLTAPAKCGRIDPETRVLNARALRDWSPILADAVGSVLADGDFPVVLGGDCTILLGSMLALRRQGRFGLLFIDGNADFFQPEAEPFGEAASMDLAFVTGHGPALLTDFEGLGPLVLLEDTVAFAFRDHEDQAESGSQPLPAALRAIDLPTVRRLGIGAAARAAVDHLDRPELDGFFIHLDADVLDQAIMPAVDYLYPGGLSWEELATVLRIALASGKAVGLEVTIYNPDLDGDGHAGCGLVALIAAVLGTAEIGEPGLDPKALETADRR